MGVVCALVGGLGWGVGGWCVVRLEGNVRGSCVFGAWSWRSFV